MPHDIAAVADVDRKAQIQVRLVPVAVDVLVDGGKLEEAEGALQAAARQCHADIELQLVAVVDEEEEAVLATQTKAEVELPIDVEANLAVRFQPEAGDADVEADVAAHVGEVAADLHLPPDFRLRNGADTNQVVEGKDVGHAAVNELAVNAPLGVACERVCLDQQI